MNNHYNHFMNKNAIMLALIDGTPGPTLCGKTFVPASRSTSSPGGLGVDNKHLDTCPECELLYGGLRAEQESKSREEVMA